MPDKTFLPGKLVIKMIDHWDWKGEEDTYPMKRRWPHLHIEEIEKVVVARGLGTGDEISPSYSRETIHSLYSGLDVIADKATRHMSDGTLDPVNIIAVGITGEDSTSKDKFKYFAENVIGDKLKKGKTVEIEIHNYFSREEDIDNTERAFKAILKSGKTQVEFTILNVDVIVKPSVKASA